MFYVYDKRTKKGSFDNNGLGKLNECIKVQVTNELNGDYSLYLEYPGKSRKAVYLEEFNIIKAEGQLFRIYKVEKQREATNIIMVWARHIFYDLAFYFIEDQRAVSCSIKTAMEKALVDDLSLSFKVDSDILINGTLYMMEINPAEAIFKIMERWGAGELYRNNYDIKILNKVGKETGVLIKYGKNIKGIKVTNDTTNLATRIYPKGANGVTLAEKYVTIPSFDTSKYPPFHIIKKIEFSEAEDEPTLRIMANEYAKTMGLSNVNIEVDFIELSRVKEYEKFKELQKVKVGDYVIVRYEEFNINVVVQVIRIKQDLLTGYNTKVELGQPKVTGTKEYISLINTVRDDLGNKVAQALSSMLYFANSKELAVGATELEGIYLGVTAVANTNLSVNMALSCYASASCTLTIKILLDGVEIPFRPKQKLQQGDNVIGIPLGIPQVSAGNHYISIKLVIDTGSINIPIYNLQCMIDGRNLQGGLSAEPPHGEAMENISISKLSGVNKIAEAIAAFEELLNISLSEKVQIQEELFDRITSTVKIELK